jgi:hypothetical protein
MPAWEAIIEQYLEGTGSRAAAESLRFRIALPDDARQEVETVLRLADRLTDATQSARPPIGAAQRLGDFVVRAGPPGVRPTWVLEGSDFVALEGTPTPGADEEVVNAEIEGASEVTAPLMSRGAELPGDAGQDLNAFKQIAAALRREAPSAAVDSVPPGAVLRLRSRLAEAQRRGEGGASPVVARRILAQLRGEASKPPAIVRPPDVLAAGEEPEEGHESPSEPDEPSGG